MILKTARRKKGRNKQVPIDKGLVIKLWDEGMQIPDIGKSVGRSRGRIWQILTGYSTVGNKLRATILNRDENSCRFVNHKGKGRKLAIHHIDKNSNNNQGYNLITLCQKCHYNIHSEIYMKSHNLTTEIALILHK